MNTNTSARQPQIIFLSHEKESEPGYIISLLKRHPAICVFEGGYQLIDNLLEFPLAPFSIYNTIFFEVLFELMSDQRFLPAEVSINEFDEIGKSKNCFDVFSILMNYYRDRHKPSADIVVYRCKRAVNFKDIFQRFIIKNLRAKYIHVLPDHVWNTDDTNDLSGSMLASVCYGILQLKQVDFTRNYEYEYKRVFSFLNSPAAAPEMKEKKKLYRKSTKLLNVSNSWYSQVGPKTNVHEEVFVEKIFKD